MYETFGQFSSSPISTISLLSFIWVLRANRWGPVKILGLDPFGPHKGWIFDSHYIFQLQHFVSVRCLKQSCFQIPAKRQQQSLCCDWQWRSIPSRAAASGKARELSGALTEWISVDVTADRRHRRTSTLAVFGSVLTWYCGAGT